MKSRIFVLILALLAATSTGCSVLESGRASALRMTRMVRPRPFDGPLEAESVDDEWSFVGDEGRAGQERERDPDQFWKNFMMSKRAQDIERNLGID